MAEVHQQGFRNIFTVSYVWKEVFASVITGYLMNNEHRIGDSEVFKIINRQRTHLLRFAEVIGIKRFRPDISMQRKIGVNLLLP